MKHRPELPSDLPGLYRLCFATRLLTKATLGTIIALIQVRTRTSRRPTTSTRRDPVQQELAFERKWGGARASAGRPKVLHPKNVVHRTRPAHNFRHPVHVTLRVRRGLPSFRRQVVFLEIRNGIAEASRRGFRVVHFSVQQDHIHLVVEAPDKVRLSRGTAGLEIRIARAVNRTIGRKGRVFAERYHARALKTPREVRHGIVYVLQNWQKHHPQAGGVDRCSSGWWFTGWKVPPSLGPPAWKDSDPAPVALPRTWLGARGWRQRGLIGSHEGPKSPIQ